MPADYSLLVSAISDVGDWRWWSESLPDLFQLEFGGVQLYVPPVDKTKPPSNLLAVRFIRPSVIKFVRRDSNLESLPSDWPQQLKDEKIGPLSVSHEEMAFGDTALFTEIIAQVHSEITHFKNDSGGREAKIAFWAGNAGMIIEAAEIRLVLMSGEIDLPTFETLNRDWWTYWREYWKKRETAEAFPYDFGCEVTIPLAESS